MNKVFAQAGLHAGAMIRQRRVFVRLCFWLALLQCPWVYAQGAAGKSPPDYMVLVLLSHDAGVYQEVVTGMRDGMRETGAIRLRVLPVAEYMQRADSVGNATKPDLIVSVGTEAAKSALMAASDTPVYMTLLPRTTCDSLVREQAARGGKRMISAIYIDQPFRRQLSLIRLTLPASRSLGVIYGPLSRENDKQLRTAAEGARWELTTATIDSEGELFRALTRVLGDSDVLLALPDPVVFNQHTTQNILLETFRQRKPVIGYSHAYVSAGALAAVYSTPQQIGRQLGEQLSQRRQNDGSALPPPQHPKYFTVEVNQQVSRSLGLAIADASELQSKIEETAEK